MILGAATIIASFNRATDACKAADVVADGVVGVLQRAQSETLKNRPETSKEADRLRALRFYDDSIRIMKASKC